MAKLNIQNNSGDKEFFTIVPNFIINHSTAIDRALYLEMKRFAGEDGNCFATEKTMMSRLAIGKKAFNKSLNYLLGKKWVEFVGITEGKTRPIKTYKINNIWQENSDYYKKISAESTLSQKDKFQKHTKISAESTLSQKDKFQKEGDKFQKHTKISAESTIEEDPPKEDILRRLPKGREANASSSFGNPLINQCIDLLKEQIGSSLDGSIRDNRRFCHLLINKLKKDYPDKQPLEMIKALIVYGLKDKWHGQHITNFKYLFYNMAKIILAVKERNTGGVIKAY